MQEVCQKSFNLNNGFLSSESIEIFDEIAPASSQKISEGNIFKEKQAQDREKIIDSERIKPIIQVFNSNEIAFDAGALKKWFEEQKRDLPWRCTPSPYVVWVSEIMLQQTQASVVIDYFLRWMRRFATIRILAEASLEEVLKMWEGLGYYSRARHLHAASRYFLEKYGGNIPNDREALEKVKGLGPYTIGAILSFAFHQKCAAVDGNVLRVLARYFCIDEDITKTLVRKRIWSIAEAILPNAKPWLVTEGLIELGATICIKKPKCALCPIKKGCAAYRKGCQERLPIKKKMGEILYIERHVAVIRYKEEWLLKKGISGKVMADLYEFPYFEKVKDIPKEAFPFILHFEKKLKEQRHSFTRYRVQLFPTVWAAAEKKEVEGHQWVDSNRLRTLPFSSGHRRILKSLDNDETVTY